MPLPPAGPEPRLVELTPYRADCEALHGALSIDPGSRRAAELDALARDMERAARPRACWRACAAEPAGQGGVLLDGLPFRSRLMAKFLASQACAFPYVATSGPEVETWRSQVKGTLRSFWAEALAEQALHRVVEAMVRSVEARHPGGTASEMHPGALEDWPLSEQRTLFRVLGPVESLLGVTLQDSLVMWPPKSLSGLRFSSSPPFVSCLLCDRPACRGRRAEHDPALTAEIYGSS